MEDVPLDPEIPALVAMHEQGLERLLARAGVDGGGAGVRLLKHHLGLRCTFELAAPDRRMALKLYADDPSPLVALLRRFEGEGLATGRPPTASPLLAWDRPLRFVVTGWLTGPSGSELIEGRDGERAAELALAWLRAAAGVFIELGEEFGARTLLRVTERRAQRIRTTEPELGMLASRCYEELEASPPQDVGRNVRHSSFKPSSLIDVGGPGVIDWDDYRQGVLEYEAGTFLAALARMSHSARASAEDIEELRRTERVFRDGLDGLADPRTLGWYTAADLVKHADRRVRHRPSGWRDVAEGLLRDALQALEERG